MLGFNLGLIMDMSSDSEALNEVEVLLSKKLRTPFDEDYTSFIESLSFSSTHLDDVEPTELKKVWTNFAQNV